MKPLAVSRSQSTSIGVDTQKFTGPQGSSKNLRVPRHQFWVGGPDVPPTRGCIR